MHHHDAACRRSPSLSWRPWLVLATNFGQPASLFETSARRDVFITPTETPGHGVRGDRVSRLSLAASRTGRPPGRGRNGPRGRENGHLGGPMTPRSRDPPGWMYGSSWTSMRPVMSTLPGPSRRLTVPGRRTFEAERPGARLRGCRTTG